MPLHLGMSGPTGSDWFVTLERLSDNFFWNPGDSVWEDGPDPGAWEIDLTEGDGANVGSYAVAVSGLGDVGLVRVRVHDRDQADLVIAGGQTYVWGGNEVGAAELLAVLTKTNMIGTGRISTVSPIASGGRITLFRGDDYSNSDGRSLEWSDQFLEAAWPDLTGATVSFETADGTLVAAGTVVTPSGAAKRVRVELTSVQTTLPDPGVYDYRTVAVIAGRRVTLAAARIEVYDREDQ